MNPLISILIPHKNTPELLTKLIDSIPNRNDIQVIVIDDNSDQFPMLERSNVEVLLNTSGAVGAGAARNVGLRVSRGEWLLFADADDFYLPNAFDRIVRNTSSKSDIVFFSPTSLNHSTKSIGRRHLAYERLVKEYMKSQGEWIRYRFHSPWSKLIRRSIVAQNEIMFDEIMVSNDIIFSLKVGILAESIDVLDEKIYCISEGHGRNLSSKRDAQFFDIRLSAHFNYNEVLESYGLKNFQMPLIRVLGKALKLGFKKFLNTLILVIRRRQPLIYRPSYFRCRYKR